MWGDENRVLLNKVHFTPVPFYSKGGTTVLFWHWHVAHWARAFPREAASIHNELYPSRNDKGGKSGIPVILVHLKVNAL